MTHAIPTAELTSTCEKLLPTTQGVSYAEVVTMILVWVQKRGNEMRGAKNTQ